MQKINIRHADLNDVPFLVSYALAMAFETEHLSLNKNIVRAGILGIIENPRFGFYVVAEINGNPVGTAMITYEWSDWRAAFFWWLQSVYVRPEHRKKGVFKAVLSFLEQKIREDNTVAGLRLYVDHTNKSAIQVYEKNGFQQTAYLLFEKGK